MTEELSEDIGEVKLNNEKEEDSNATPEGEWEVDSILDKCTRTWRCKHFKEYLMSVFATLSIKK